MVPFSFHGESMALSSSRALYWPRMDALLVADLHLEKASFYATGGQMLPPYDSRETLARLADLVRRTGARRVFGLGDSFHDDAGLERLEPHARGMLDALTRAVDWTWIVGNHDAGMGSKSIDEVRLGGVVLRHCALGSSDEPEISGHFHPKVRINARGRRIARPCAVLAESAVAAPRLVLPAFGALTGGMNAADPVLVRAMQPAERIDALVPLDKRMVRLPLWREAA
ncbi:MAG: ligase-associated DNA damage response endonuclease PdeM [Novosphingobium sp.]|nr:ligase-associated DNA damage response endonuclease PdeM [Novosphingobium sp.]